MTSQSNQPNDDSMEVAEFIVNQYEKKGQTFTPSGENDLEIDINEDSDVDPESMTDLTLISHIKERLEAGREIVKKQGTLMRHYKNLYDQRKGELSYDELNGWIMAAASVNEENRSLKELQKQARARKEAPSSTDTLKDELDTVIQGIITFSTDAEILLSDASPYA